MSGTLATGRAMQNRWYLLCALLIPSCLLMAADRQAMVVMAPHVLSQLGLDLVQMTQIIAAASLAYAAFQLPGGWLCQKLGAPVMLAAACVMWSLFVLVTPLAGGLWGLIACRFLMGIGQAPDWTANMMVVKRSFETSLRAKVVAVLLSAISLGSVIGAPLSLKIMKTFGWQACFYVYGAVGLALSVLLIAYAIGAGKPAVGPDAAAAPEPKERIVDLFRSRQFHAVGFSYFCLFGVESFFLSLMPLYLTKTRGMPLGTVGWAVSFAYALVFVSKIVGGALSDFLAARNFSLRVARIPMAAGGILGGAIILCLGLSSGDDTLALILIFVSTFLLGFGQIGIWASIQDLGASSTGMVASWTQLLGNVAGGVVPIAISLLVKYSGNWVLAEGLMLVLGVGGALCLLLVRPHEPLVSRRGALSPA